MRAVRRSVPARGAGDRSAPGDRASPRATSTTSRLILLEEGHCLRDQALAFCATRRARRRGTGLGATSLATVMQMVANGYGVTLVPQIAADVELRDERVKLLRLSAAAGPHHRARVAPDLAAQGGFCRARRSGEGECKSASCPECGAT